MQHNALAVSPKLSLVENCNAVLEPNQVWQHQSHNLRLNRLHIYRVICITEPLPIEDGYFVGLATLVHTDEEYIIFCKDDRCVSLTKNDRVPVNGTCVVYENIYNKKVWQRSIASFLGDREGKPRFTRLA